MECQGGDYAGEVRETIHGFYGILVEYYIGGTTDIVLISWGGKAFVFDLNTS